MNPQQRNALWMLIEGKIDESGLLQTCGLLRDQVPAEVERLLRRAPARRNAEEVDFALTLGSCFSFPNGIVELVHELILQDWHISHERMIRLLQGRHESISVPFLRKAIAIKPTLRYLDYDDYGAYYKKCLWALQCIGTPEAVSIIEECALSNDAALRKQAAHRLTRIRNI